jgi:hypothetical protein
MLIPVHVEGDESTGIHGPTTAAKNFDSAPCAWDTDRRHRAEQDRHSDKPLGP